MKFFTLSDLKDARAWAAIIFARARRGRIRGLPSGRARSAPAVPSRPSPEVSSATANDRVVFEHVVAALIHRSGYERIATPDCSDRTIRRHLKLGRETSRPSPRHPAAGARRARSWSTAAREASNDQSPPKQQEYPRALSRPAPAGMTPPLLAPTFVATQAQVGPVPARVTGHLDVGYDSGVTRDLLAGLGFNGEISRKESPASIQADQCWVVERTRSWMNGKGRALLLTGSAGSAPSSSRRAAS